LRTLIADFQRLRFWRHFAIHAFAAVGVPAVLLGLFDLFFPDVLSEASKRWLVLIVLFAFGYAVWRSWPRPISQEFAAPKVTIRVIEGDLLAQAAHLVIGMSTTFDTEPPYISKDSVQGQFLERLYDGNLSALNRDLGEALVGVQPIDIRVKEGKQDVYPLGTVATIKNPSKHYFCVAYTEMNERNRARGTAGGLWTSLEHLWEAISNYSNGGSVAIPVIGGGQSRLSQVLPAQDAIRFIILSFILASRVEKVCDELVIVVRPGDYKHLDRLELQSFLRSLRKS